ncbi:MAG: AAC(3) family N-acetyltransferase [Gemmatimonadota bacterium]
MTTRALFAWLPASLRARLKEAIRLLRYRVIRATLAYSPADLDAALRRLGIGEGDSILMQASFSSMNGFSGDAPHVIDRILSIIGPRGHLFMVSMPYRSSAQAYLESKSVFDVRRTPSMMGVMSESFRRRAGVIRSANPLHPLLAWGPRAEWVISGHEDLAHSCGPGSPYEKMLSLGAKALFFDVGLEVLTFTHCLEHRFQDTAPVPVYTSEPMATEIIDRSGQRKTITVFPFAAEAMRRRNFGVLYDRMIAQGDVARERVGNTELQLATLQSVVDTGKTMIDEGTHIYAAAGQPVRVAPKRRTLRRRFFTLLTSLHAMRRVSRDGWRLTRRVLAPLSAAIGAVRILPFR